jgi:hypothetical protein
MNAVEIEEAVSALAERPFDREEFPFAFLEAFGNKETTLKRLRKGESNKSDLGGVLQTNNIHIAVAAPGEVTRTLTALRGVRTRKCILCPVHKNKDGIQRENQCGRCRRRALAGQIGRRGRKTWTRRHVFTQGLSCKRVESSENSAPKNARG